MKTLRKTLSLTLVFALVFSLMSFAFAADTTTTTAAAQLSDFTDADKLTYTEAADYLIAAGIVKGETATTLNPTGDFTRAQAAKLISYAALGQVAADKLAVSTAPFNDVDASNWAAGYIAYCQKQGFVNGYGDGNFGPNDKVTGYQMAKMLLCSIGYGVNSEFTGSGWELAVAPTALSYGIFTGNAAGASSVAATREEAFLYTFNTLSALCNVTYNKTLGVYYVPGRSALTTNPQSVTYDAVDASSNDVDTRYDTVGAIKFGLTRQVTTDDFDNAAHEWILNKVAVTDTYANDNVKTLGTITDGTLVSAATTNTNAKYIASPSAKGISYFYNGAQITATSGTNVGDKYVSGNKLMIKSASTDTEYSVKGATVALMAGTGVNASKVEKVSIVEKEVAQLGSAPVTKTSGSVTTVTITDCGISNINVKNVSYPTDLAEDDVVLYYQNGSHYYVEKATSASGNVTGYVAGVGTAVARVTIGTSNYYLSQLNGGNVDTTFTTTNMANVLNKSGYAYYLDSNGYVCYAVAPDATASLTSTVFVSKVGTINVDDTFTSILVDSTGATTEAKISKYNSTVTSSSNVPTVGFCTYTKQSDGTFALVPLTGKFTTYAPSATTVVTGTTSYAITAKQVNFLSIQEATVSGSTTWAAGGVDSAAPTSAADQKANGSTVFLYYNADTKSYTAKTGITNALNYTAGGTIYVLNNTSGYATFVVAKDADTSISNSTYDQYFIVSLGQVGTDASGATTYTYIGYKNGTLGQVNSYEALNTGYAYYAKAYAANGYIKTPAVITPVAPVATYNSVKGVSGGSGVMTLQYYDTTATTYKTKDYILSDSVKFFVCNATDKTDITYSTTTFAAAKGYEYDATLGTATTYDAVTVVPTSDTDSSIAYVYITLQ